MIQGIIGKKIGMTQIFTDDGRVIPVTMIQAGPCLVVQKKAGTAGKPARAQLGFVEPRRVKHVTKAQQGHFAKANVPPTRRLHEFRLADAEPNLGDTVGVDIFSESEIVCVCGTTKGKGMPGRMGGRQKTVRGLEVVRVDKERNVLMVRGAVPGCNGNYLYVLKDSFARR